MPDEDIQTPGYWDGSYEAGTTPWELPGMPRQLARWIDEHPADGGAVLIPGCGSGWEVAAFLWAGWRVTAIDFAPAAVAKAKARPGGEQARLIEGDFFTHGFAPGEFNLIYERTFLTAIGPARWAECRARYADLLARGGRVAGYFLYGEEADPPPFAQPPGEPPVLAGAFELAEDAPSEDALPFFGERERWQVWVKL